jgi:hypothetical protein
MKKNNCKGTIYKINNQTYCIGEKNKSKKSKKSNNKSKRLRVKLKNKFKLSPK